MPHNEVVADAVHNQPPQRIELKPPAFTIPTEAAIISKFNTSFEKANVAVPESLTPVLANRIHKLAEKDSTFDIDKSILQAASSMKEIFTLFSSIIKNSDWEYSIFFYFVSACENPTFIDWLISKPDEFNSFISLISSNIKDEDTCNNTILYFVSACENPTFIDWLISKPDEFNSLIDFLSSKIRDQWEKDYSISYFVSACENPTFIDWLISKPDEFKSFIGSLSSKVNDDWNNMVAIGSFVSSCKNPTFIDWIASKPDEFNSLIELIPSKIKDKNANERAIANFVSACENPAFIDWLIVKPDEFKALFDKLSLEKDKNANNPVIIDFFAFCSNSDFLEWLVGKERSYDAILFYVTDSYSLGEPLDSLHAQDTARANYLASLTTKDVLMLLLSDPKNFYTSSNHMLFDRLLNDIKKEKTSINGLLEKYEIFEIPDLCRNLAFRAINYDRLSGKSNSLFSSDSPEFQKIMAAMLENLNSGNFNEEYFYLLANAAGSLKGKSNTATDQILLKLAETAGIGDDRFNKAVEFLIGYLEGRIDISDKAFFNRDNYAGKDNKLQILQVFDKEDTGGDFWPASNKRAKKRYEQNRTGPEGELIYENKSTRMTLFMGEDAAQTREFIKKYLGEHPNSIITFRGHSYSLDENFPSEIFGNREGKILFIPGSCGSSGAVPLFKSSNPKTDLTFMSNSSTGRGMVTEELLDILAGVSSPEKFINILRSNEKRISNLKGDISTIQVYSLGEQLIDYVERPIQQDR